MSWRRVLLAAASVFIGYLLWLVIDKDSAISQGAVWPLIFAFIIILMLPESRLEGNLFVKLVSALKGKPDD